MERKRGNQTWWWMRKSRLYKASGCWPFYSSHTKTKKGLQKHDTLTLAHGELTPAEMVNDREWREGQWMIKYFKVLLHRFVVSVHPLWRKNKTEISYWERHAKMEIANHFTTVHTWVMTHYPLTLTTAIKDPTAVLWFSKFPSCIWLK